jgi:hypothetical protein
LVEASTIAQTPSGGVHLYYRYPIGVDRIPSRSRVLPGIDIKADDAYVVIPTKNDSRRFWKKSDGLTDTGPQLLKWLETASGRSSGKSGIGLEYDFNEFVRNGCPDGYRDDFFNKLAFGYRKAGLPKERAIALAYEHWLKCAQPAEFMTEKSCGEARWYMPWKDALYKIERVYKTVTQDENRWLSTNSGLSAHLKDLDQSIDVSVLTGSGHEGQTVSPTHPQDAFKILWPKHNVDQKLENLKEYLESLGINAKDITFNRKDLPDA